MVDGNLELNEYDDITNQLAKLKTVHTLLQLIKDRGERVVAFCLQLVSMEMLANYMEDNLAKMKDFIENNYF